MSSLGSYCHLLGIINNELGESGCVPQGMREILRESARPSYPADKEHWWWKHVGDDLVSIWKTLSADAQLLAMLHAARKARTALEESKNANGDEASRHYTLNLELLRDYCEAERPIAIELPSRFMLSVGHGETTIYERIESEWKAKREINTFMQQSLSKLGDRFYLCDTMIYAGSGTNTPGFVFELKNGKYRALSVEEFTSECEKAFFGKLQKPATSSANAAS